MRHAAYTYTPGGKLKTMEDWLGLVTTFEYDQAGRVIKEENSDGYTTQYSYHSSGLVEKVWDNKGWSMEYTRDENGRITSFERSDNLDLSAPPFNLQLAYNSDNQVEGATYDVRGNFTESEELGIRLQYNYKGLRGLDGEDNVELDDFGNVARILFGELDLGYTWDPMGDSPTMLRMTLGQNEHWNFVPGPNGQIRYGYNQDGDPCYFLNDGFGNIVGETDGKGNYEQGVTYDAFGSKIGISDEPYWLGYGGAFGKISIGGYVLGDGGRDVNAPSIGAALDARSAMPGYPATNDPRTENQQSGTGQQNLDDVAETIDDYLGGGFILGPKPAPAPETPIVDPDDEPAISVGGTPDAEGSVEEDDGPLPGLEDLWEERQAQLELERQAEQRQKEEQEAQRREEERSAQTDRELEELNDFGDFVDPNGVKPVPVHGGREVILGLLDLYGVTDLIRILNYPFLEFPFSGENADGGSTGPQTETPQEK